VTRALLLNLLLHQVALLLPALLPLPEMIRTDLQLMRAEVLVRVEVLVPAEALVRVEVLMPAEVRV
jgi:hypothetical protein